jgi:hypothetical protein
LLWESMVYFLCYLKCLDWFKGQFVLALKFCLFVLKNAMSAVRPCLFVLKKTMSAVRSIEFGKQILSALGHSQSLISQFSDWQPDMMVLNLFRLENFARMKLWIVLLNGKSWKVGCIEPRHVTDE